MDKLPDSRIDAIPVKEHLVSDSLKRPMPQHAPDTEPQVSTPVVFSASIHVNLPNPVLKNG